LEERAALTQHRCAERRLPEHFITSVDSTSRRTRSTISMSPYSGAALLTVLACQTARSNGSGRGQRSAGGPAGRLASLPHCWAAAASAAPWLLCLVGEAGSFSDRPPPDHCASSAGRSAAGSHSEAASALTISRNLLCCCCCCCCAMASRRRSRLCSRS
jgi:hypothetical protein